MPYTQVTLAAFRQELKDRIESVPYWTDIEANNAINESLRVWNMLTGMWKRRITFVTVANQVWYTLPGTMVYSMRFEFNGQPLEQDSLFSSDNGQLNWEAQTTATSGVPTRPSIWMPAGLTLFAIWPADAIGQNSLLVDGIRATPFLGLDADFVDIGQAEHDAILGYALHVLAFKEGGARFAATQLHYKNFITAAGEQNERLKASTLFRKAMGLDISRSQRPVKSPPQEQQGA